jgi:Integrase core domain
MPVALVRARGSRVRSSYVLGRSVEFTLTERHRECIACQLPLERVPHRPADHSSRAQVEHDGQVEPAFARGYVRYVRRPDRGVQYECDGYRALLSDHQITASMSRRGNCWDNAASESFFATLKTEPVMDADWATREEARCALFGTSRCGTFVTDGIRRSGISVRWSSNACTTTQPKPRVHFVGGSPG